MRVTSKQIKIVSSFSFAVVVAVILVAILIILKDSLAWMCLAFGLAAGWAVGILLAPYQSEQIRFREYLKLASVFVTGYAVSKIDRVFELWIDPARGVVLLTKMFGLRVLICLTAFILATVTTYIARKYVSFGPGSEQQSAVLSSKVLD